MPKPRGPNGSIRGIPAGLAQEYLVELVRLLAADGQEVVKRSRAAEILRGWFQDETVIEGFLLALERTPGFEKHDHGLLQLPAKPVQHARHRSWRLSLGRADLADAQALAEALRRSPDLLTPNLERLEERLMRATQPLLREEGE